MAWHQRYTALHGLQAHIALCARTYLGLRVPLKGGMAPAPHGPAQAKNRGAAQLWPARQADTP